MTRREFVMAAEKRPKSWDMVVSDNRNLVCTFNLGEDLS